MNANLKNIGKIALGLAEMIVPQIKVAEDTITGFKKGGDRRAAVVNAVTTGPILAEVLSGHEIVNDALWQEAVGDLNDAIFKMQRAIKEKDAPPVSDAPAQ